MRIVELNDQTKDNLLESLLKRSPSSYGEYEQTVNDIITQIPENTAIENAFITDWNELKNRKSVIYEFDQGLNFNIIVSKNYMWNMSFSGSGTLQNNIYSFITEGDTQTHNITINASSTNLNNSIVV